MSPVPTSTEQVKAIFDPFAKVKGFQYAGSIRAAYPLSPKSKVPPTIRRPNYAREGVRNWLAFWWQVSVSLDFHTDSFFMLIHCMTDLITV